MNARWAEKKIDDRQGHRQERGGLDESGLRRVDRVEAGQPDGQRLQIGRALQVDQRQEVLVPGPEEVEQA